MIGVNIDLTDTLANGLIGVLKHIEMGTVVGKKIKKPIRIQLDFEDKSIGLNQRMKFKKIATALKLAETLVPIELDTKIIKIQKIKQFKC